MIFITDNYAFLVKTMQKGKKRGEKKIHTIAGIRW